MRATPLHQPVIALGRDQEAGGHVREVAVASARRPGRAENRLRPPGRLARGGRLRGPWPLPAADDGRDHQRDHPRRYHRRGHARVAAVHADAVYYDVGAAATTASARLDGGTLKVRDLRVSFLAVDSTGVHQTGPAATWQNRITLKHRAYQSGSDKRMELRAAPDAPIWYTTDGSDPKLAGAAYDGPFIVPRGAPLVLAYAERDGVQSAVESIPVSWEKDETVQVDARRPAAWKRQHACGSTKDSYDFLARLDKYSAQVSGLSITISGEGSNRDWVELNMYEGKHVAPDLIEECLEALRKLQDSGQVRLTAEALHFANGQGLLDWVEEVKTALKAGEVKQ